MQSWTIGRAMVTKVFEVDLRLPPSYLLRGASPQAVDRLPWLRPHFVDERDRLILSIHSFVVESEGERILVDTCVGDDKPRPMFPDWDRKRGSFLSDLVAAGFPPGSIDRVLCTHLHVDHVGWNTRRVGDRWVPTFPNARYLIGRKEWEFWSGKREDALTDAILTDSVGPILDAGLVDLVDPEARVNAEIALVPTPGHTPGHVSVEIRSAGEEAVITGDLLHHPIQCTHPDWRDVFDVDPSLARRTRRAFLERVADRPVLVLGTHFPTPTAGRVVRDGETWRLDF